MSQYVTAETKVKDPNIVVAALLEMGISRGDIEVNDTPVEIMGYGGVKRQAEIVIRNGTAGLNWGDMGIARNDEGNFVVLVDDYDCKAADDNGNCEGDFNSSRDTKAGGFAHHLAARCSAIALEKVMTKNFKNIKREYRRTKSGQIKQIVLTGARK
jgi:hypothetical protein